MTNVARKEVVSAVSHGRGDVTFAEDVDFPTHVVGTFCIGKLPSNVST